ncbi:MAG: signal peptidase I [Patescibacteria group bacterium]|jgi:signal peptidase
MKKLLLIRKALYAVLFTLVLFVAIAVSLSAFDVFSAFKLFTVQSGSMEPAIKVGSLIVSVPESSYQVGDIITYRTDTNNPKATVTHRLVEIKNENNQDLFVTKGDANDAADPNNISPDNVVGRVSFTLPYLGYPVAFAQTQTGLIVMIIIPATIIIYSELLVIKEEMVKIIKKHHGKNPA